MKTIAHCSDTHSRESLISVPKCDILVHSGDANISTLRILNFFISWMSSQPATYKIFVAGNHDDMCEAVPSLVKQLFHENGVIYLDNAQVEIEGIKIWGSPYTPRYGGWSFMKERGDEMLRVWKMIPEDTDILITHGPPMGILDFTTRGQVHAGCWDLGYKIRQLKPKLHLFGHVHEGYGTHFDGTTRYYNSSIMDVDYQLANELQMINYED